MVEDRVSVWSERFGDGYVKQESMSDKDSGSAKRMSYSKIDTYVGCPYRYKKVYVDRAVKTPPSVYVVFGDFVHCVLEDFCDILKDNNNQFPDNVSATVTASWKSAGEKRGISHIFMHESRQMISDFSKLMRKSAPFEIIDNERSFKLDVGQYKFTGKVDQIIKTNGDLVVRDYKTNKTVKYLLEKPLQLKIYAIAMSQDLRIPVTDIKCSYVMLREGAKEYKMAFTQSDIDDTRSYLESVCNQIDLSAETGEYKAVVGPLCPYCPVVGQCPAAMANSRVMTKYAELKAEGKVF